MQSGFGGSKRNSITVPPKAVKANHTNYITGFGNDFNSIETKG